MLVHKIRSVRRNNIEPDAEARRYINVSSMPDDVPG